MRIVDLNGLGKCLPGTIFSDFEPCIVSSLYQLHEVIRYQMTDWDRLHGSRHKDGDVVDFFYSDLIPECRDCPRSHPTDDYAPNLVIAYSSSRWGLYDDDARFVVYEPEDLEQMISLLHGGIP